LRGEGGGGGGGPPGRAGGAGWVNGVHSCTPVQHRCTHARQCMAAWRHDAEKKTLPKFFFLKKILKKFFYTSGASTSPRALAPWTSGARLRPLSHPLPQISYLPNLASKVVPDPPPDPTLAPVPRPPYHSCIPRVHESTDGPTPTSRSVLGRGGTLLTPEVHGDKERMRGRGE